MKFLPRFSVENPVLVGILMTIIVVAGVYSSFTLIREMFPESRPNQIVITAPYPGATPLEVERGLALRIEEAVKDEEHIDKIVTDISEGLCTVRVDLTNDADDLDQATNDIKAAVDSIPREDLPEEAEEIQVMRAEPKLPVIAVTLYGDIDERTLKQLGERLRTEILRLPNVSDVDLGGTRKAEIGVDVRPEKLVEYRLSLRDVAAAIASTNLDLPAGQLKTASQNVAVRTLGETDDAAAIAATILRTTPAGELVRVSDVATVHDGFVDTDSGGRFNGKPAVSVTVYKTSEQDAIEIASNVKAYVAGKLRQPLEQSWTTQLQNSLGMRTEAQQVYEQARNNPFPEGIELRTHNNLARFIESRLDLLTRNGTWGLFFVFLSLLLFLNWRVAFWVMAGLFVSVAGAIVVMQMVGATLNLISMFGLIVALGLIVDDAIVVGENIYARVEQGEEPVQAAIEGAQEVTWPVVTAVCTTIGAFLPLMFIEGQIGDFMGVLPVVVMCALGVSLLEALSLLPSHLADSLGQEQVRRAVRAEAGTDDANGAGDAKPRGVVAWFRRAEHHLLMDVLGSGYRRLLTLAINYRYVTIAAVVGILLACFGLVAGQRVPFVFIQKMDSETLMADLDMPVGTPVEQTRDAMAVVEQAALNIPEVDTIWAIFGAQLDADEGGAYTTVRSHIAQLIIELKTVEERDRPSDDIVAELRRETTNIPGAESIRFRSMQGGPAGPEFSIEVTSERMEDILVAAEQLKEQLASYAGVYDIADDFEQGRRELQIELLDSARPLGFTTRYVAEEVRGAFYGIEARTLQRGREDVDIRVRYPEDRRRNLYELEQMRIMSPAGQMVPLAEVARITEGLGTSALHRVNQRRAVVVAGDVDQREGNADLITEGLLAFSRTLEQKYPGLRVEFAGSKREATRALGSLGRDFMIALLLIYCMLAALFRSYFQPVIVLTAVPFGLIGAILGHLAMGYPMTILSRIGLVALTGIVVNDSLILVEFINANRARGVPLYTAVIEGGMRRLRPIILTSLTTILGLAPLMTETSFQARFLIPLAISISFGLVFATVLTLFVVPANYLILEDVKGVIRWVWTGSMRAKDEQTREPAAGAAG